MYRQLSMHSGLFRLTKGKALGGHKTRLMSEVTEDGQHRPSVVLPRQLADPELSPGDHVLFSTDSQIKQL